MLTSDLSTEQKINKIYMYLFSDEKASEEEDFWNKLNDSELKKIDEIRKEEISDFDLLKSEILWK